MAPTKKTVGCGPRQGCPCSSSRTGASATVDADRELAQVIIEA
jgi:hypothetical protein